MTEIFHQLGHNHTWNLESIQNDSTGTGVIIGPRYISRATVEALPQNLKSMSIFNPQFYVPNSSRGKLATYDFFPNQIADGFRTSEWTRELALQSARGCLTFQAENEFKYLVIPTRHRDGMPSDYIESQSTLFAEPFLQAYEELQLQTSALLQLVLTDQMLKDRAYITNILNWVTSLNKVEGVYLIYQRNIAKKQVDDIELLMGIDFFIRSLKNAGMIVVVGHMNTESIPLLCSGADIMTVGSYENLRMFGIKPYEIPPTEKKIQRGPNVRIYIPRLLQWVEQEYMGAVQRVVGNLSSFIEDNQYAITMFEPGYKWYFNKPQPYMHYFVCFAEQFHRLAAASENERVELLKTECRSAMEQYNVLREGGIVFGVDSSGDHLSKWLTFLNQR